MSNERYAIIVSGEKLVFTRDQIQSDPGNYLATYFFGDFAEGSLGTRELVVEKDVQLFKLIQAHLRGYKIIPLADTAIPWYMTKEGALSNLLQEAQFYCLQRLVDQIEDAQSVNQVNEDSLAIEETAAPKQYRFWTNDDIRGGQPVEISEEIYEFHLSRLRNITNTRPIRLYIGVPRGFRLQIAWKEILPGETTGDASFCALFVSHSVPQYGNYNVIVSGERFVLTRNQLESEPGSYFATYFLGDFAESANGVKELVTEKEPLLFKLIQAHLRGYEILPLASAAIPTYMTAAVALTNLLEEAQFYGLDRLVEKIKEHQSNSVKKPPAPAPVRRYLVQYRRGRTTWQSHQINEEQYRIYLNRYIHLPKTYSVPEPSAADGYTTQATWLEVMSDDPKEPKVPCRLVVYDDV